MPATPGQRPARFDQPRNIYWGGDASKIEILHGNAVIDPAARDAGNVGYETVLRAGLLMGRVTATGKLKEWNNSETDGTETVYGVLDREVDLLDRENQPLEAFDGVTVKAPVRVENLLIRGQPLVGDAAEAAARTELKAKWFTLNDEWT